MNRRTRRLLIIIIAFLTVGSSVRNKPDQIAPNNISTWAQAITLIDNDLQQGNISVDEAVHLRLQALRDPDALPVAYQPPLQELQALDPAEEQKPQPLPRGLVSPCDPELNTARILLSSRILYFIQLTQQDLIQQIIGDRVVWRREGLKVPQKQPKMSRLWLNDGSVVRLKPFFPQHVWSYDFLQARTHHGVPFRILNVIDE